MALQGNNLLVGNGKNNVLLFWLNGMGAGKHTKGGQDALLWRKIKTRHPQALPSCTHQPNARMNVAADNGHVLICCFRFVHKPQPVFLPLAAALYVGLRVPVWWQHIVVAFYQQYVQLRYILPPAGKPFMFFVGMAVKKIAHYQQPLRLEMLQQGKQPHEVLLQYFLRHGNAMLAKMAALAQVQIAGNEGLGVFPKHHLIAMQPKALIVPNVLPYHRGAKKRNIKSIRCVLFAMASTS